MFGKWYDNCMLSRLMFSSWFDIKSIMFLMCMLVNMKWHVCFLIGLLMEDDDDNDNDKTWMRRKRWNDDDKLIKMMIMRWWKMKEINVEGYQILI